MLKPDPQTTPLEVRRNAVIHAAKRLSSCADEFDGDMSVCSEYLDALWCAVDCLKAEEAASNG